MTVYLLWADIKSINYNHLAGIFISKEKATEYAKMYQNEVSVEEREYYIQEYYAMP